MRNTVDMLLRKYGTEITLCRGEEAVKVRGFFQPVNSTSWQSVGHTVSPLGYDNRAEHLCILPAAEEIREGDALQVQGRQYLAQRVESYCCCDQVVYRWALCVAKGVEDAWGN